MEFTVIGIRAFDYESKNGTKYRAVSLSVTCPVYKRKGDIVAEGEDCEKIFCRQDRCAPVQVGDKVRVLYNKFGSVDEVVLV